MNTRINSSISTTRQNSILSIKPDHDKTNVINSTQNINIGSMPSIKTSNTNSYFDIHSGNTISIDDNSKKVEQVQNQFNLITLPYLFQKQILIKLSKRDLSNYGVTCKLSNSVVKSLIYEDSLGFGLTTDVQSINDIIKILEEKKVFKPRYTIISLYGCEEFVEAENFTDHQIQTIINILCSENYPNMQTVMLSSKQLERFYQLYTDKQISECNFMLDTREAYKIELKELVGSLLDHCQYFPRLGTEGAEEVVNPILMRIQSIIEACPRLKVFTNVDTEALIEIINLIIRHYKKNIAKLIINNWTGIKAKNKLGTSLQHIAAHNGYDDILDFIITDRADVNTKDNSGSTPLHIAARYFNYQAAKLLIDNGADVNSKDNHGSTLLSDAIHKGSNSIVKLLIENGADVNTRCSYDQTPLMTAARKDCFQDEIVELLLAKGADVNAKNQFGQTPLSIAIGYNELKKVELFIQKGANVNTKDQFGSTPLYIATDKGFTDIVNLLKAKGAI